MPPNLFTRTGSVHRSNVGELPPNQCRMFFPVIFAEECLISTALEYFLFHPAAPISAKFQVALLNVGELELMWCYFPKTYQETCRKISAVFGMAITHRSRGFSLNGATICFPQHEDLLFFSGERDPDLSKMLERREDIMFVGNRLQASGID